MNNINSSTNNNIVDLNNHEINSSSLPISGSVYATIDAIIAMLQKINSEIRDMERDFYASQQGTAFKKDLTAMESKKEAIHLNYKAALSNAISKTTAGAINVVGAGVGAGVAAAGKSLFTPLITAGANGMGSTIEGSVSASMASKTRDGQHKQLLGEFQSNSAGEYHKTLSNTADKAAEASKKILDMTREMMALQERILSSVRI